MRLQDVKTKDSYLSLSDVAFGMMCLFGFISGYISTFDSMFKWVFIPVGIICGVYLRIFVDCKLVEHGFDKTEEKEE